MLRDELRRLIRKEIEISDQNHRAWTPWRKLLAGEIDKQIGCISKGCKASGLYVSYQVEANGSIRLCACADHADHATLRNKAYKRYRYHVPLQVGIAAKAREGLFNKAELRRIRRYDFQLNMRFEYERRAKAGDTEAYEMLQKYWRIRLPMLEAVLIKLGHWPINGDGGEKG